MRVLLRPALRVRDVDLAQQLDRALGGARRRHLAVRDLAFDHLTPDGEHRVERGRRVLEHHADVAPAHAAQRLGVKRGDLHAVKLDRALQAGLGRQQAADGQRRDALARPRLADDAQDLAGSDVEVDATHRRHRPAGADEADLQSTDPKRQRRPMVRKTGMLSISRTMPPTFLAATMRPMS